MAKDAVELVHNEMEQMAAWSTRNVEVPMLIREVDQCLRKLNRSMQDKGGRLVPHVEQLRLAITAAHYMGLSLSPWHHEACLIPFAHRGANNKFEYHDIVLCTMIGGYRKLARMSHPSLNTIQAGVALAGDEWSTSSTSANGIEYRHRRAPRSSRKQAGNVSGALSLSNLLGAYCRIDYLDGRPPTIGVLDGEELHEKLRANRNFSKPKGDSGWRQHPLAMVEKTVVKYTISKQLGLFGVAAAATELDGAYESGNTAAVVEQLSLAAPNAASQGYIDGVAEFISESPKDEGREPAKPGSLDALMQSE